MKVNVLLSPLNVDELYFSGKTTVVIDVLRASTVIVTALNNGAKELIPVDTVDFALKVSGNAFSGQTLLGGERNTIKIDGFLLGNSPLEYTKERVKGKTVILYTTNGSKTIVRGKYSENLVIGSFNNLSAVVNYLLSVGADTEIVCSASNGKFCIEDTVCAGMIIDQIQKSEKNIILSDSARASILLYNSFKNIPNMLSECEHGKKLIDNGFVDDLEYCANVDSHNIVPYYKSGALKILKEKELHN